MVTISCLYGHKEKEAEDQCFW